MIVTIIDGIKETSIFPKNSSLSERGVARRASIVFRSFSPAKLSDAITLDAIRGMMRKKGAKKYSDARYTKICGLVMPLTSSLT
jgi:hypothetical protein